MTSNDLIDHRPLLQQAQEFAERLIIDGKVDADNDAYDGVRALFQLLHGLPVTGRTCKAISEIERQARERGVP